MCTSAGLNGSTTRAASATAVTKSLSGAARATIDACRTLFIWLYALHAGWESFHALEVVGFVVLISGTSLYNEIIKTCLPGARVLT